MKAFFKVLAAAAIGGFATGFTSVLTNTNTEWKHALAVGAAAAATTVAALFLPPPQKP